MWARRLSVRFDGGGDDELDSLLSGKDVGCLSVVNYVYTSIFVTGYRRSDELGLLARRNDTSSGDAHLCLRIEQKAPESW
jgi:hypothetical protein